ncbi:hypothetical protein Tco_0523240 [Tanacetum coccineum]
MAGPKPITPLNKGSSNQNKSIIEGHVSALKELLKEPSNQDLIKPMLLDVDDIQDDGDERIVKFSSPGHRLPSNAKIYDGTGDSEDHIGQFVGIGNQGEWPMPVSESNAIPNVLELMQISSFMSSYKCPELAKCFADNVPRTVDEMLKRVDDYLRSKEAFCNTELPRGEFQRKDVPVQWLELALESGKLSHLVKDVRQRGRGGYWNNGPQKAKIVNNVQCHSSDPKRKTTMTDKKWMNVPIIFPPVLARDLSEEALVIEAEVEGYLVPRIHIDEGALIEIMFEHCFNMLHPSISARLVETQTTMSRFLGEQVKLLGKIELDLRAVPSTIYGMMKFPTPWGVATLVSQTPVVFECRREGWKQAVELPKERKAQDTTSLMDQVLINPAYPEQLVTIRTCLSPEGSSQLKSLLKKNIDIFAWEPSDMTRVPKRIIKHSLNANLLEKPISQKRMVFFLEKIRVIIEEVGKWLKAGIVRPVKYPTLISNPVLVKKAHGSWRMCIDFKNINAACPKDYYPPPEIDSKIDAVIGFPLKCFLDAYKGYHQVQMVEEDKEKTAFYTDQGTYCYTKMPFGLKNAEATYQRLVDGAFQS